MVEETYDGEMSTFLDIDTSDAVEPTVVGPGEYRLRIIDCTYARNKNGDPYLMPLFEIPDEPTSKPFSHYLGLPVDSMDDKTKNTVKWRLESFQRCFGFSLKGINISQLVGLEGWALLGVKDDPEYGEQNVIKKYIEPR